MTYLNEVTPSTCMRAWRRFRSA